MNINIAIIYFSGAGHTKKVAEYVSLGVKEQINTEISLINCEQMNDASWEILDKADGIIFGCPTYMAGPPAAFKGFMDKTSQRWYERKWLDKIGAGFTNSGGLNGDKSMTIVSLFSTAMQHGMIWVGQSEVYPKGLAKLEDINRLSGFSGLITQSENESVDVTPPIGDLKTAKIFGLRVARITAKFRRT